ncbi:NYN domain [Achromobacter sp. 2789STDY5608615]|uniref:NYN domain-containing protein n=2 Tax=unclassified Achromobacter TaxID=2626865 RepID=UPI0006C46115|nr:NYN domain-containing protein [Achromobacter sp. 2789STDY5608615]CUK05862.1 NYN domain [Achromobacter sp. 2789STDY5608615]
MNAANENVSMALFCDFENVALGVRDTKYQKFDIRPVLERLLLKGSIVVKKAYCDWERYKEFKAPMHEANFELIEIPHVRQSGKNSADIRLVVDALDFCYTKSHVNTFVIISGDSDFSPLVSKLRENNKKVIGVGVKQSTSDLLIANCDEFIFYDDLAREGQRAADARRDNRGGGNAGQRRSPDEERRRKEELEARKTQAVDMVVETFEALMAERGDSGKVWASALKDALKRRRPDFNESYYGFRAFGNLLDEAQSRGFLDVGREEKSGTYVYRDSAGGTPARVGGKPALRAMAAAVEASESAADAASGSQADEADAKPARGARGGRKSASGGRGGRQGAGPASGRQAAPVDRDGGEPTEREDREAWPRPGQPAAVETASVAPQAAPVLAPAPAPAPEPAAPPVTDDHPSSTEAPAEPKSRRGARSGRGAAKTARAAKAPAPQASHADGAVEAPARAKAAPRDTPAPDAGTPGHAAADGAAADAAPAKPARKTAPRARRPRKAADAE